VRKLLRRTAVFLQMIMAPGATLNARHELEEVASRATDLDAQLRRMERAVQTPHAA